MEPSSLALIAIVGVWAAYLVPHWVRRRDVLADSRTGDRDSARLRLLSPRRRTARRPHRSGGPVLASPKLVVDTDGQLLFIPGERPHLSRAARTAASTSRVSPAATAVVEKAEPPAVDETPAPVEAPATTPVVERPKPEALPVAARPAAAAAELHFAMASSHRAAGRRVRVLGLLAAVTAVAGSLSLTGYAPSWAAAPVGVLLALHLIAGRVAAVRSHEHITLLAERVRTAEALAARPSRVPAKRPAAKPAAATKPAVRRPAAAAATGTWDPVPVPPPTYTLKPAVRRPLPAPYEAPAAPAASAASASARGSLPRTAADIERILAMEEPRRVVNG
ncbi:hypothetical protein ACIB24_17090 [Spongisporangium articulatum]|uniref:Uncharacterized protein n=1 Tax=Spongisporangium articulatum TaxID=3362603 RepID=A0ABW8AT69_9ACTN